MSDFHNVFNGVFDYPEALIVAQLLGAFAAIILFRRLVPQIEGEEAIVPHEE